MGTGLHQRDLRDPRTIGTERTPADADWNGNRKQRRMAKKLKLPKPMAVKTGTERTNA